MLKLLAFSNVYDFIDEDDGCKDEGDHIGEENGWVFQVKTIDNPKQDTRAKDEVHPEGNT